MYFCFVGVIMALMLVCIPTEQAVMMFFLVTLGCVLLPFCLIDCVSAYRTEWPGKVNSDEHTV